MPNRSKLLILTSKTGGGHVSLAEALRDQLESAYEIKIIDPYSNLIHAHYRFVSRHALWLWSTEFRLTNISLMSLLVHRIFTQLASKPLNKIMDDFQPDIVITTHPFLSYEVQRVLEKCLSNAPLVLVFSDPEVHATWLSEKNAAATFATTHESYKQALDVGFDPAHLHLVGWPVRKQFYHAYGSKPAEILTHINLDPNRFTIFLQGGGEGAARIERTLENVLSTHKGLQVILAAGTNQALFERFKDVKNLYALPFTKEIAPFMAAADIIMGKAGVNVVLESVTLGKPFIATSYIPGQEEGNLGFIERHELGWVALKPERLYAVIAMLLTRSEQLSSITAKIDTYRQWNYAANQKVYGGRTCQDRN